MVTEERDELRNLVNEFKRPKNDEAGDKAVSGAVLQVILFFLPCLLFYSCDLSYGLVCDLVCMDRSLNRLLQRKNYVLKNWRVVYMNRRKSIIINMKR
jgi:hypothetical protein